MTTSRRNTQVQTVKGVDYIPWILILLWGAILILGDWVCINLIGFEPTVATYWTDVALAVTIFPTILSFPGIYRWRWLG